MPFIHPDIAIPSFLDEKEVPDPLRLRRARERWPGLEEASGTARIVVLEHGGRRRPIIGRNGRHRRSRLVSRQTRVLQITEGNGLPFLCRRWEVDASVADWEAHPFIIILSAEGEILVWYPDGVFVRFGGLPTLVEVKRTVADLADRAYAAKLGAMAEFARRIGWSFQIQYDVDVFGSKAVRDDRRANVQAVWSRRFLLLSEREQDAVEAIVAAGAELTWGAARATIAPEDELRGDAVIECAIARGRLHFDFDAPRTSASPLRPVAATAAPATFRI